MIINVHGGHNRFVSGASQYLNEVTEDRLVKNEVIALLKKSGHTVYDCTDEDGKKQNDNLKNIVQKCNSHHVDLDVSIHLNAGGGHGVEVLYCDDNMKGMAANVSLKIANALGIYNRGAKKSTGLYVLNSTKAPAILIECCFVDSREDQKKWNVNRCAQAIVEGLINKSVTKHVQPTSSQSSALFLIKVDKVPKGDTLIIREKPDALSPQKGSLPYNDTHIYTIVETKNGWGRLKSGQGWISLAYTQKVK